jgi:L-ribulose-5-phosphate 3-epimerase
MKMRSNRRDFLRYSATAAIAAASAEHAHATDQPKPMRLGVFVGMGKDPAAAITKVHDLGFPTCQMSVSDPDTALASQLKEAAAAKKIEITAISSLGPGKHVWDFYQGPLTIGVVPATTRRTRIDHLKKASDFAKLCGVGALHSHAGFIPENPNDPLFKETVDALREIGQHCKANSQILLYETGQESPVTLLRAITEVGLDNQFVCLDTANLILYGKGNPVDALDVVGKLVRAVHAKDGLFPTDPKNLGQEVPIGKGKVDFPQLIKRLKELGYKDAITIERETSGVKQAEDIRRSKAYLEKLIG